MYLLCECSNILTQMQVVKQVYNCMDQLSFLRTGPTAENFQISGRFRGVLKVLKHPLQILKVNYYY